MNTSNSMPYNKLIDREKGSKPGRVIYSNPDKVEYDGILNSRYQTLEEVSERLHNHLQYDKFEDVKIDLFAAAEEINRLLCRGDRSEKVCMAIGVLIELGKFNKYTTFSAGGLRTFRDNLLDTKKHYQLGDLDQINKHCLVIIEASLR